MANISGGQRQFRARRCQRIDQSNDLAPIFHAIEEDLRSQYLLGFYAGEASRDGRNHRFKVSLPAGVEYQVGSYGYSRDARILCEDVCTKGERVIVTKPLAHKVLQRINSTTCFSRVD